MSVYTHTMMSNQMKLWFADINNKNHENKFVINEPTKSSFLLPLSPLFDAVVDDDFLAVKSFIDKRYDINTQVRKFHLRV
ncbi:unnamed protein product [Didymodactylos carnosus]|uniref:Uncharacterized protein n=1 Tax=Didymodactylos carnosus TaxID=1234261 RepID=A0A8S2T9B6_9BILA|nr:unnamed protein product [Didymodactylos carnosus]CAF4268857.1 unnamed protein product [Didymodactylos carnosus]